MLQEELCFNWASEAGPTDGRVRYMDLEVNATLITL